MAGSSAGKVGGSGGRRRVVKESVMKKITLAGMVLMVIFFGQVCPAPAQNNPVQATRSDMTRAATLKAREEAVAAREKELTRREAELGALQVELDEKLARLATLQEETARQLAELKDIKSKRFKNLINVYSSMSATKVAPLLNSMEDKTVAEILGAMKNDLVAKIVPKLDPEKAVRVSRIMGLIKK